MQLQNTTQTAYIRFVVEEIEYSGSQGLGCSLEIANNQTNKTLPNTDFQLVKLSFIYYLQCLENNSKFEGMYARCVN
jgi:hypothetical protein